MSEAGSLECIGFRIACGCGATAETPAFGLQTAAVKFKALGWWHSGKAFAKSFGWKCPQCRPGPKSTTTAVAVTLAVSAMAFGGCIAWPGIDTHERKPWRPVPGYTNDVSVTGGNP